MGYKPDYGLRLLIEGMSPDCDIYFYSFRLFNLAVLARGQYSTMVDIPRDGEWFALSLDFNQEQLEQILSKAPTKIANDLCVDLSRDPASARNIDLPGEIVFGVRARLGQLQHAQHDDYVPLVLQEVLAGESDTEVETGRSVVSGNMAETLRGLEGQRIVLDQIANVGVPLFAVADQAPLVISGECYAYDFGRLSANQDQSWHWTLMRAALVALARQRAKMPVLAAYELAGSLARLFLCANDLHMKSVTHVLLASVPGYSECGLDGLSVEHMRPVAYWTPVAGLVALWPLPIDTRSGPYVVDASNVGNQLPFFSYPEAEHRESVPIDLAGPNYLRVPDSTEGRLDPENISYVNRWAECVYPGPALR